MRTIYQYNLDIIKRQTISVPSLNYSNSLKDQFLSVSTQGSGICLWCMVDTDGACQDVEIYIASAGDAIGTDISVNNYLGSVMVGRNSVVWHVFSVEVSYEFSNTK